MLPAAKPVSMAPIMTHITIPSAPVIMVCCLLSAGPGLLAGGPGLGDGGVRAGMTGALSRCDLGGVRRLAVVAV
jgi:hypothetical protein